MDFQLMILECKWFEFQCINSYNLQQNQSYDMVWITNEGKYVTDVVKDRTWSFRWWSLYIFYIKCITGKSHPRDLGFPQWSRQNSYSFLGCCAMQCCGWILIFQRIMLPPFSRLKMEEALSFRTMVSNHHTAQHNNLED